MTKDDLIPATARPAAGVHLFYLDDAGILFSESTQELHVLNTTAAVIWSLLEEGHDAQQASAALQAMSALDASQATQFVSAAVDEWTLKGFLGESKPLPVARTELAVPGSEANPPWREFAVSEERHYCILSSSLHVRFSSRAQALVVHPILEHLEVSDLAASETVIDVIDAQERIAVYRDREFFADCARIVELAPVVKSLVWYTAVRNHAFFLDIHAGVVGKQGRCILLPAPAGSGKSTLTALLVAAGFDYYSDEIALLDERRLDVFPMPLAICVKTSGLDALAPRFPHLRSLAVHERGDGKQVRYMPPPRASLPADTEPRPVAAIVFPRYTAGAETSLQPCPKVDALKRLMEQCMVVSPPLDASRTGALVRWIERTPCYSLSYGSSEGAIDAVSNLFMPTAGN